MTRRNDPDLGVANRMTWTVNGITDTGAVQLHSPERRQDAAVDADYVRQHLHLAYACTVHGVQGDTADHADSLLSDSTDAAAAYVALTRGRYSNTVHIVAGTVDEARETVGRRGRPEPRRPRPGPGPRRRPRRGPELRRDHRPAAAARTGRREAGRASPTGCGRSPPGSPTTSPTSMRPPLRSTAERAARQEWDDGIDEHQDHDTPTQSGPHL